MASLEVREPPPVPSKEYVLTLSQEEAEFVCAIFGRLGHKKDENYAKVLIAGRALQREIYANQGHVQNGIGSRIWQVLRDAGLDS